MNIYSEGDTLYAHPGTQTSDYWVEMVPCGKFDSWDIRTYFLCSTMEVRECTYRTTETSWPEAIATFSRQCQNLPDDD